ncbi:unnamed protein product [Brachionus calyciflorus]|nr:unnamed protein product [Brachionus calyciflorus]
MRIQFEKNILGSQLVRRNDEISLLYEKIKLLEKILKRGEACYNNLTEELNQVKSELVVIKNQNDILKQDKYLIKEMKKEIFSNDKELMLEKAKRNAIEKIQKSVIIHRWRNLKGYDPSSYELILKVNTLQKKLIHKTEDLVCLQLKMTEKDRLFLELKKYFSRRILSEDDSQLVQNYKNTLLNTSRKIKTLLAENNMLLKENEDFKIEIEKTNKELRDTKIKYYTLKSKDSTKNPMKVL